MTFTDDSRLGDARAYVDDHIGVKKKGVHCACCGQMATAMPRAIHGTVAKALIIMWRTQGHGWFHWPTHKHLWRSNDAYNLRYYGLIQPRGDVRRDGGPAGWWRVTAKGRWFIEGELQLTAVAWVYNKRLVGWEDRPPYDIHDALGTKFNYRDLLDGVA